MAARFGFLSAHAVIVEAAIVAAHGATAQREGFRASDVRFFFLLFANWVELDVLRPGQDLELTQIRRALARLDRERWVTSPPPPRASRGARRGRFHRLTEEGLVGLVSSLVAPGAPRSFEEVVFLTSFALSYRDAVVARVRGDAPLISAAARRRVGEMLAPRRVLASARRRLAEAAGDLDERITTGLAMERSSAAALRAGAQDRTIAVELERASPYQLHGMRPFAELILSLPEDLRRFELSRGMGLRARMLFRPLADHVRAQIAILDRLESLIVSSGGLA